MIADLPDLIAKRSELAPGRIALEDREGRTLDYGALETRSARLAAAMRARRIGAGDRVAFLARNGPAFFEILFACAKIGAILVPLNWRMPVAELRGLIADCAPALLFRAAGAPDLGLETIELGAAFEALIAGAAAERFRRFWPAEEAWYLIYTSGTTGRPKGVIYTYGMALANYVNVRSATDLVSTDTNVAVLPVFHTAGINLHALPTLFAGGRVIVLDGFDADAVIGLLEAERLDTFFAVPTVYQALLDHPRFAAAPLGRVRHWGCGGAPLPDILVERCRALGIRVCNGMGMTETGPTAFLLDPADAWERIGSVGKPQLLCSARIVRADGSAAAPGEVGDLHFAGPGVTPGYWRNEEATRAAFTDDGWLRSGDLARTDEQGFYYIAGRRKEMFISGGENVYPAEVENVLCGHPAVADAAVLPVPDPRWGEVGRAFVLLAPERPAPAAGELDSWCRDRLAAYKVPRRFDFVEDFPRSSAGKIQKHLLS